MEHAKSSAYRALGSIRRSFKYWTPRTFKIIYSAYVRPHLEHCSAAWSPQTQKDIASLESVQRRATKMVPSLRNLSYFDRLKALDLTTLEHRRERGDLIQYFKIHHELNIVNWIKPNKAFPSSQSEGPACSVRGQPHRLVREAVSNCSPRDNFLPNRVLTIWNSLTSDVINSINTNAFKNKIDKQIYQKKT